MSVIGEGGTGLVSGLRTYVDLQSDQLAPRESYLDLVMGKAITKTGTQSGAIYYTDVTATALTWAGRIRPVVGLEAMKFPRALVRVERLADIVAGRWYTDDSAIKPGDTLRIYYQMYDSSDPGTAEMVVHLLFNFATKSTSAPMFAPELLPDPIFNIWDSATVLHNYTPANVGAGGVRIDRDTELAPGVRSNFSLKVSPDAGGLNAAASGGVNVGGIALEAGREYWVCIDYLTPLDQPAGVVGAIRVRGDATNFMLSDGVSTTTTATDLALDPTYGRYARATFVMRAPSASTSGVFNVRLWNTTGGTVTAGYAKFFRMSIRPVYRYLAYDGLISAASVPVTEVRSAGIAFDEKTLGFGDVTLLDPGDKSLLKAFAGLFPLGKPVTMWTGGAFSNRVQLLRDDWHGNFMGVVDSVDARALEGLIALHLEDTRTFAYMLGANAALRPNDYTSLNVKDAGRPKAMLFGETAEPAFQWRRVELGAKSYGEYELVDPEVPVREARDLALPVGYTIRLYAGEEPANKDEAGYEFLMTVTAISVAAAAVVTTVRPHGLTTGDAVTLSATNSTPNINGRRTVTVLTTKTFSVPVTTSGAGTTGKVFSHADVDFSNNNTRLRVLRDIRNFRFARGGGHDVGSDVILDFEYNGVVYATAAVDYSGPGWLVAADAQAAMQNASGGTPTVVYNETTHKFDFAKTGVGTWKLLTKTGVNAGRMRESWKGVFGMDTSADKTSAGAGTFSSDDVMFEDADRDHVFRAFGASYNDDASGGICGVANANIDNAPAVSSWLLQKKLNLPPSRIYVPSFSDARNLSLSTDLAQLLLYVKDDTSVLALLALMDRIGVMDTVMDGEGVVRCQRHSDSAPVRRSFFDRDYLSFSMKVSRANVFKSVRVWGGYDPTIDRFTTYGDGVGVADAATEIKHGVGDIYDLDAWLTKATINGGTQLVGNVLTRLFKQCPPIATFECLGKLMDLLIGDRIQLTADAALTSTGSLSAVNFRILDVQNDHGSGVGQCVAVQDVTIHT